VAYHYEGAGPTSGDYCDILETKDGTLYFMIGDVRGKGLAAAMAMAHVHATFRALVALDLPLVKIVERASRTFCESTLPSFFATLVCGKAGPGGAVEICNAGHVPPLLLQENRRLWIEPTGLPLGMFCDNRFTSSPLTLSAGDTLILCTDGVTEARNREGDDYGAERLLAFGGESGSLPAGELVSALLGNLKTFCSGRPGTDDVTIMAVRRRSERES
jgi:sigma-B regulation protein RsbU (phosphoserine phosphatase)